MRLRQEPGQLLTGRFLATIDDSASGSGERTYFYNICSPAVALIYELSRTKVLKVDILRQRRENIFFKYMFSRRCFDIRTFANKNAKSWYIKATAGEHIFEKYVLPPLLWYTNFREHSWTKVLKVGILGQRRENILLNMKIAQIAEILSDRHSNS